MNISIDLLPQRSRTREGSFPFLPAAGALSFVTAAGFLVYSYIDVKNNVQALEQQIVTQTDARNALEADYIAKTTGVTEYNYVDYYNQLDHLLSNVYQGTVLLKQKVYGLLPEDAVVNTYNFSNSGDLTMTITFPSKGESAVYLSRLLEADVVDGSEIQTIALSTDEDIYYRTQFTLKLDTLAGEES